MDEGPFRNLPPADRRGAGRPAEPVSRQQPESSAAEASEARLNRPAPAQVAQRSAVAANVGLVEPKKSKKSFIPWMIIVAILAILAAGFLWINSRPVTLSVDSNKYQAVFFVNGQHYFGKLEALDADYVKLTNVFYLQADSEDAIDSSNPQGTGSNQSNMKLIKLGDEIHGPEDEMIISKAQLLFYENLKNDSKVVESINKYKASN